MIKKRRKGGRGKIYGSLAVYPGSSWMFIALLLNAHEERKKRDLDRK